MSLNLNQHHVIHCQGECEYFNTYHNNMYILSANMRNINVGLNIIDPRRQHKRISIEYNGCAMYVLVLQLNYQYFALFCITHYTMASLETDRSV